MITYKSVEDHIGSFPPEVQKNLREIQSIIRNEVPEAVELINYGIPTFKLNGKNLIHYAAFKTHIGLYPGANAIEVFKEDLTNYKTSKGTIQLPLDKPLPINLVRKIVKYCVKALS